VLSYDRGNKKRSTRVDVMSRLRTGDWVEVRSKEEILRTLDNQGRLDGMPFMPQMFQYCGQRLKVFHRAHKTCDTIAYNWNSPGRKLRDGIHLNLRCDGKAYGGCQAACLIYWKEAWLNPVDDGRRREAPRVAHAGCSEADVKRATRVDQERREPRYFCQATEVLNFTTPLPWWDARQYVEDYTSGNASLVRILRGFVYVGYHYGSLAFKQRYGGPARWLYDRFQALWGGLPYPRRRGTLREGEPGPVVELNLQPGDFVKVKSYAEILATINSKNRHRGMAFDGELVPYCGRTLRVRTRVEKFIDEQTGHLKRMKTPAVILEGAFCRSRYSNHRMFCPRSIFAWWREVWLERVPVDAQRNASDVNNTNSAHGLTREEFRDRIFNAPVTSKSGSRKEPATATASTALGRSSA
jgi:hypothetical protein